MCSADAVGAYIYVTKWGIGVMDPSKVEHVTLNPMSGSTPLPLFWGAPMTALIKMITAHVFTF